MSTRFGPAAYIVRYAWWSAIVPAAVGAFLIAGFFVDRFRRPPSLRWLPGPNPTTWNWVAFGVELLLPFAGLCLLVLALRYVGHVANRRVAFAVAARGVYWCPSGKPSRGRWFSWDEIGAIVFHPAEGSSTGRGAVALLGHAARGEDPPVLVSSRLGGWRIARRRLARAVQDFAPNVDIVG